MPAQDTSILISRASAGQQDAISQLLPLVYDELYAIAARKLQHERPDHTLQPTALVNEAYLRLADQSQTSWHDKAHFCALAATMMRRVLVDHARRRAADKRQGKSHRIPLSETDLPDLAASPADLLAVNDLLERLAELNPRHARVFELRCFGGLDVDEVAAVLDISSATVRNDWRFARAWLASQLNDPQDA